MPWENEVEEEEHHSDTRTVTVVLGTGDMVYDWFMIVDKAGVERNVFAKGESVCFNAKVTNRGVASARPKVSIYDEVTGILIMFSELGTLRPGEYFIFDPVTIAPMPNHDWHLRCELTP